MRKIINYYIVTILFMLMASGASAQGYTFEDFVGTWNGTISSTLTFGYNDPITMTIESDGFYTETSGHLMPSLYPDTQECEFDAATNRFHWWYLDLVYAGQYFYQHFYYEIVYFSNDTLEMHYNFWDDPEPWPEVGTIFIVRENMTPAPTALNYEVLGNDVVLSWDEPVSGNGGLADYEGFNIYHRLGDETFEFVDYVTDDGFIHYDVTAAGLHAYRVTAVYDGGESDPSNEIQIDFVTPPPASLEAEILGSDVVLTWAEPSDETGPMAGLSGYNVFHKEEGYSFEFQDYAESNSYTHHDVSAGIHTYYITAVYDGGESDPSNEVMIEMVISAVEEGEISSIKVYPNPANEFINVESGLNFRSVLVCDLSGRLISTVPAQPQVTRLHVAGLEPGLYLVRIENRDGTTSSRKIFVQ